LLWFAIIRSVGPAGAEHELVLRRLPNAMLAQWSPGDPQPAPKLPELIIVFDAKIFSRVACCYISI
jgi:hypothetical protein